MSKDEVEYTVVVIDNYSKNSAKVKINKLELEKLQLICEDCNIRGDGIDIIVPPE